MQERFEYLDVLRGFAMLMVVLGHLVAGSDGWSVSYWVNSFHLPLFLFVGGFLAYRTTNIRNGLWAFIYSLITKRALSLLIPYLLWSCILFSFIGGDYNIDLLANLKKYIIDPPTMVLWFLYTYFFLNILYCIYLAAVIYLGKNHIVKDTIVIVILFALSFYAQKHLPVIPRNLAVFFPYYFLGVLFSKYLFIEELLNRKYLIVLCALAFGFTSLMYGRLDNGAINLVFKTVAGCSGSLVFYYISKNLKLNAGVESILISFGKNSIVIYILHFTMLFSIYRFFEHSFMTESQFWLFISGLIVAVVISYCCVILGNLLKTIPFFDGLLFGRWKFKKSQPKSAKSTGY